MQANVVSRKVGKFGFEGYALYLALGEDLGIFVPLVRLMCYPSHILPLQEEKLDSESSDVDGVATTTSHPAHHVNFGHGGDKIGDFFIGRFVIELGFVVLKYSAGSEADGVLAVIWLNHFQEDLAFSVSPSLIVAGELGCDSLDPLIANLEELGSYWDEVVGASVGDELTDRDSLLHKIGGQVVLEFAHFEGIG